VRVLIIEDHPIDLKLFRAVLQSPEDEVTGRTNLCDADELVGGLRPDVILLDLHLRGEDALSFVRSLRERPVTRGIPVVALTAYPLRYPPDEVLAAGCALCIVKPVDTRSLADQVRGVVRPPATVLKSAVVDDN
jgi:CheY-like chemotaxis protein